MLKEKIPAEQPQLVVIAEQQDDLIGDKLSELIPAPRKPYKGNVVTALADAVRDVIALMDRDLEARPYRGPVDRLDPDLVRFMAAALEAAEEYGQPAPVKPGDIRSDNELIVITEHLRKLSRDRDFKDFLEEELEEELAFNEEAERVERSAADDDAMLMSRM